MEGVSPGNESLYYCKGYEKNDCEMFLARVHKQGRRERPHVIIGSLRPTESDKDNPHHVEWKCGLSRTNEGFCSILGISPCIARNERQRRIRPSNSTRFLTFIFILPLSHLISSSELFNFM